jgi:hypothetical protein
MLLSVTTFWDSIWMSCYIVCAIAKLIIGLAWVAFVVHSMLANWLPGISYCSFPKLQSGVGGMGESTYAERMVTSGRLIVDTYLAAKVCSRTHAKMLLILIRILSNQKATHCQPYPKMF